MQWKGLILTKISQVLKTLKQANACMSVLIFIIFHADSKYVHNSISEFWKIL